MLFVVQECCRKGMDQDEFTGADADMGAEMLVPMAVGYIVQGLGDPTGADWGTQDLLENFIRRTAPRQGAVLWFGGEKTGFR
jgi:hypothetical protein